MRRIVITILRCCFILAWIAWLWGMVIPWKISCSNPYLRLSTIASVHGRIFVRYCWTDGERRLSIKTLSPVPRATSARVNMSIPADEYMFWPHEELVNMSWPDFGGWSWQHGGFWLACCPQECGALFPPYFLGLSVVAGFFALFPSRNCLPPLKQREICGTRD